MVQHVDDLSPDGYSRFFMLADILQRVYGKQNKKISILDVGGASEFLAQKLTAAKLNYDLTIIDILEKPKGIKAKYIQGDATKMDFADSSFDVVLSTDVLEHVPGIDKKQAFLDECLRVAKDLCIIAAPFDTAGVNEAEVTVNEFNKKLFGVGQSWLEEHLEYGKPSVSLFTDTLKRKNIMYHDLGTQNIMTWLLNTQINLVDAKLGLNHADHVRANHLYNENILHMNEFSGPTYRHFFIMYVDSRKKDKIDLKRYLGASADGQKIAQYLNMLVDLSAKRITGLSDQNNKLQIEATKVDSDLQTSKQTISELKLLVSTQQATLDKWAPVFRLVHNRLVDRIRKVIHRARK